ncbi:MAG: IS481 family transposase [Thermomicrobiales bacterium]
MNVHKGARTTPWSRALMVQRVREEGQSVTQVAAAFGVSETTVRKWLHRADEPVLSGVDPFADRSSRPHQVRNPTATETVRAIEAGRRDHQSGKQLAVAHGCSRSTVSRYLRRAHLSRAKDLEPVLPPNRYELPEPGALIHFDTKKLGRFDQSGHRITGDRTRQSRGIGWEAVHVAIDDHSRVAQVRVLADERSDAAVQMLRDTVGWYREQGIAVTAIMTDNGSCYRSHAFRAACAALGVQHRRTRPYTPRTNGKAERFIQTALREWAYATTYDTSDDRAKALSGWVETYNTTRPHTGIGGIPPMDRIAGFRNNLLQLNI